MVIQRWQSVMLLLASVCMIFVMFLPVGFLENPMSSESATLIKPIDNPVLMIVEGLTALLLIISIFLFKNMKLQTTVVGISMLLIVACIATSVLLVSGMPDYAAIITLAAAFLLCVMACRFIRSDRRKLSESNRLR